MKTVIIGGVAAGASAAARLRRLDESMEIVLVERGSFISFANCGLPYHVGGVIPRRESLFVITPEQFRAWFNVDVRTESHCIAIDRNSQNVVIQKSDGSVYVETYDRLLLATGASPKKYDLPGADDPRVMNLWTIPDMDQILTRVNEGAKNALVVGAGFIGAEVAENLRKRGLEVTLVEKEPQILPHLDPEMTHPLADELKRMGIKIRTGIQVRAFKLAVDSDVLFAILSNDEKIRTDLVVMTIGVAPNSELAHAAGLEIGPLGHIRVNAQMRTSDPSIYAVGDVVEVLEPIFGGQTAIPLAGPASKQGRVAADNISGRFERYAGSYGAEGVRVGEFTAGSVGFSEKELEFMGAAYQKIYLHPETSANYFPGGTPLHFKLLFSPRGKILGAQIIGKSGVDKRIDVLASAMRNHMNAPDLRSLELAYAPQFNSARDPVNTAGMICANVLNGETQIVHANRIPKEAVLLDVRRPEEFLAGTIPGAVNLPLEALRSVLGNLERSLEYVVFCRVGQRGYFAERILRQNGFRVRNLSGGLETWKAFFPGKTEPGRVSETFVNPAELKDSGSKKPEPPSEKTDENEDSQQEIFVEWHCVEQYERNVPSYEENLFSTPGI